VGAAGARKGRAGGEDWGQGVGSGVGGAGHGLEFHRPLRTTPPLEAAVDRVRSYVPRVEEDRVLSGELAALAAALRTGEVVL